MDFPLLLHHTVCGGVSAAGFGVLFNFDFRVLPWCAISGALMLAVRTVALQGGWSMEAACFAAAFVGGTVVQLLPATTGVSRNALHVVGCIPMLPGGLAAKAILGLFAIAAQHLTATNDIFGAAIENTLGVTFTVGAIGIGLAIPTVVLRVRRIN